MGGGSRPLASLTGGRRSVISQFFITSALLASCSDPFVFARRPRQFGREQDADVSTDQEHLAERYIQTELEKRLGVSLGYVLMGGTTTGGGSGGRGSGEGKREEADYHFEQHRVKRISPAKDEHHAHSRKTHGYIPFHTHVDEETQSLLQVSSAGDEDSFMEIHERPYHYAPSAAQVARLDAHHEKVRAMNHDALWSLSQQHERSSDEGRQRRLPEVDRQGGGVSLTRTTGVAPAPTKRNLRPVSALEVQPEGGVEVTALNATASGSDAAGARHQVAAAPTAGSFVEERTNTGVAADQGEDLIVNKDEGDEPEVDDHGSSSSTPSSSSGRAAGASSFLQDIAHHIKKHTQNLLHKVGELLAPTWSEEEKEDNANLSADLAKQYHGVFWESHKTTPLTDKRDATSQHLGTIFVGRQQQRLNVIFDSGSTNLWLAAAECDSVRCQENKETLYDLHKSGSEATMLCKVDSQACSSIKIEFGSGSLGGPLGMDTVYIAGHKIENQRFALIHSESGSVFDSLKYGGIMGLAFEDMSSPRLKSVITNAIANNVFQGQNIMAFYFTKNPSIRSGAYFGGVNPKLYHGVPVCLDVQKEHYWQTGLKRMGFRFGAHGATSWVTDPVGGDPPKSIFWDTGTTWNGGPTYMTRHNLDFLHAHGGWNSVECSKLHVKTGTENLPYMVLDLCMDTDCEDIYRVVQPPEQWYVGGGGGLCKPAFMSIDVPPPYGPDIFVTGEIFMRSFFTIFDRGSESGKPSRVCIAKNKTPKELSAADYDGATELTSPRVVKKVFETRHRPDEPYGKDADKDG